MPQVHAVRNGLYGRATLGILGVEGATDERLDWELLE